MDFIRRLVQKEPVKILFGILVFGILTTAVPYIYSPKQCPTDYTQQQVDASNCIIGADIGSGMIWLLGISSIIVAVLGLSLCLITTITSKVARVIVALLIIATISLIIGILLLL